MLIHVSKRGHRGDKVCLKQWNNPWFSVIADELPYGTKPSPEPRMPYRQLNFLGNIYPCISSWKAVDINLIKHAYKISVYKMTSYCFRWVNSMRLTAYIHQWNGSALVHVMVCRLFGAKPLHEPWLLVCLLDHQKKRTWMKSEKHSTVEINLKKKIQNFGLRSLGQ